MLFLHAKEHGFFENFSHPNLGRFCHPRDSSRLADTEALGIPWAADNNAFSNWNRRSFANMVYKIGWNNHRPIFVTCPDVVANAELTLRAWERWATFVREAAPVALVGQNGLTPEMVPWDEMDAFFVGGDTEWKLGEEARELVKLAKDRGKWVHMGRVSTIKRIKYAIDIGVDSIDSSACSRYPPHLDKVLGWIESHA